MVFVFEGIGRVIVRQRKRSVQALADCKRTGESEEIVRTVGGEIVTDAANPPAYGLSIAHGRAAEQWETRVVGEQDVFARFVRYSVAAGVIRGGSVAPHLDHFLEQPCLTARVQMNK